jgi:lactate dehydrogenase-like 2-hydroxyacid dehydrogenase
MLPKYIQCILSSSTLCAQNGIVVFNTPGSNANAVKELVLCGLFMSVRGVSEGINWARNLPMTDPAEMDKVSATHNRPLISHALLHRPSKLERRTLAVSKLQERHLVLSDLAISVVRLSKMPSRWG